MTTTSIGDLAQTYMMRSQNTQLKAQMNRLSEELVTGRTADVADHLNGNYAWLGDVERGLRLLDGYQTATQEATLFSSAMQAALDKVQTASSDLGATLITVASSTLQPAVDNASEVARGAFQEVVSALNTAVGGRSVFAGVSSDSAALESADAMLADIRLAVAGEVTLSGVETAVSDWFNSPTGGFETMGYLGAAASLQPMQLAEELTADLDLRADDDDLKSVMQHIALAALAADDTLAFDPALQRQILARAGEQVLGDQTAVTSLRADLGFAEERISTTIARNAAEKTSLEIVQSELLGVDQYQTATELENAQFRLETLYSVTVRLSRLNLAEYMR